MTGQETRQFGGQEGGYICVPTFLPTKLHIFSLILAIYNFTKTRPGADPSPSTMFSREGSAPGLSYKILSKNFYQLCRGVGRIKNTINTRLGINKRTYCEDQSSISTLLRVVSGSYCLELAKSEYVVLNVSGTYYNASALIQNYSMRSPQ